MSEQLSFDGQDVTEIECRVSGEVGDARLNKTLAPDDKVVLVIQASVRRVDHLPIDGSLVRRQHLRALEGFVVTDVDADDLIQGLRADRKKQLDALLGTPPIEGLD